MTPHRLLAAAALAAAALAPPPGHAQGRDVALTLAQAQRRFPGMSPIHIAKCDGNRDGLYTRGELACVRSVYGVMYLDP
jgi:hypothetical protein